MHTDPVELSPLHERLHAVVGHLTYTALGTATRQHPETVRRYMQGAAPAVEFLTAVCSSFDVNAQWLLTGQGPLKQSQARAHALREANPAELLSAIAAALERLTTRVDRIELFVQTMETRLRARIEITTRRAGVADADHEAAAPVPAPASTSVHDSGVHDAHASSSSDRSSQRGVGGAAADGPAGADRVARARRIADAAAKRPRPDAD